jgi:GNAT superfamily N-acetyltransferase
VPGDGDGAIVLRDPLPGELGWIVSRHAAYYGAAFGFDMRFEALVAEIVAAFARRHDPARERLWIAARGAVPAGSIMVVAGSEAGTAKLRLLMVEEAARGAGLGRRLVAEAVRFAREAGYRRIELWTYAELLAARRLYEEAGFACIAREQDAAFGPSLVSETWSLTLSLSA